MFIKKQGPATGFGMLKRIFVLGSILLLTSSLYASLSITPSRQEVWVTGGQVLIGTYTVTSDYGEPTNVKMTCSDWFTLPENKNININDWLKIYPSSFTIEPGEQKNVNYEVVVPTSAKGEMVAMVSFTPNAANLAGITFQMSTALFVTVAGTEKYDWDITKPKIFKDMSGKLQVNLVVKNKGNVHVRPIGLVQIISRKTKQVVSEFNFKEGRPAYPGNERQMVTSCDFNFEPGKYTAITTILYQGVEKIKKVNFAVKKDKKGEITIQ